MITFYVEILKITLMQVSAGLKNPTSYKGTLYPGKL